MIIDGKQIAKNIENELLEKFKTLSVKKVVFVMFGENTASRQFMGIKSKTAERLGIDSSIEIFPESIATDEAVSIIKNLNTDFDGVVVQLPLPKHLDTEIILNSVLVEKDIDVLSTNAIDNYKKGVSNRIPPVAGAVQEVLNFTNIDLKDKNIVLVGNGNLVGKPVGMTLSRENTLYSIIDIDTPDQEKTNLLKNADIIISGVGIPHMIKPDMIKSGVILIDAGTSESAGKLVGDIDPACVEIASYITPVPGGVGPVTVVMLFRNLLI